MIPQPIVSRSVSRAITRGDRGRRASLHRVLAPPRVGLGEPDRVEAVAVERARVPEDLLERLHRQLHHANPERDAHPALSSGGRHRAHGTRSAPGPVFGYLITSSSVREIGVGYLRLRPMPAPAPCAIDDANDGDLEGILAIYNDVIATSTAVFSERAGDAREPPGVARRPPCAAAFPVLVALDERRVAGFGSFGDFRAWPGYRITVEHTRARARRSPRARHRHRADRSARRARAPRSASTR